MTDEDTRSLPAAAQAALRTRAVGAVLDGRTQAKPRECSGCTPTRSTAGSSATGRAASRGLAARRRGRRAGEQAARTEPQQQEVIALVRGTTPDQLGLVEFLWTREAVAALIARRSGMGLARTTVGGYLRGWGFTPSGPSGAPWSRTRARCAAG
jgi:transposase